MTDREMAKKLYAMGRNGVSVDWRDNAFIKTAGRRMEEMAKEIKQLQDEIAVQELYDRDTLRISQKKKENPAQGGVNGKPLTDGRSGQRGS